MRMLTKTMKILMMRSEFTLTFVMFVFETSTCLECRGHKLVTSNKKYYYHHPEELLFELFSLGNDSHLARGRSKFVQHSFRTNRAKA